MFGRKRASGVPPGFRVAMIALALAWLVVLVILSRMHRAHQRNEPTWVLPVYPDAYKTDTKSSADWGWQMANYLVRLDYPALDVYTYYDDRMREQGWSRSGAPAQPEWMASPRDAKSANLMAAWISPDQLMRLDLQLIWERRKPPPGEQRAAPEMRVSATMARNYLPVQPPGAGREKVETKQESPFSR